MELHFSNILKRASVGIEARPPCSEREGLERGLAGWGRSQRAATLWQTTQQWRCINASVSLFRLLYNIWSKRLFFCARPCRVCSPPRITSADSRLMRFTHQYAGAVTTPFPTTLRQTHTHTHTLIHTYTHTHPYPHIHTTHSHHHRTT